MSLSLLYWEPQNWTQNSTCVSPELSRGEESPVTICWQCSSWQSPGCCWLYFCTGTLLAHIQLGEAVVPKSKGVSPHSQSPSRVSSLSDCSRLDQARSWGVPHTQTPALLLAVSDPHILVLHKRTNLHCILHEDLQFTNCHPADEPDPKAFTFQT